MTYLKYTHLRKCGAVMSFAMTLLLLSFLLMSFKWTWGNQTQQKPPLAKQEEAIHIAKKDLPSEGILQQGLDGYVYVKVANEYVHRLFPLIKEPGFVKPGSITRNTKIGAHISVFYKKEAQKAGQIKELGKVYSFKPVSIRRIRTGKKEYIILDISAPELESLRESYGLSPLLQGHDFHITLAEKKH